MKKQGVYLDYNATTPLHPEVKKAMQEAFELFGNASSLHSFGQRSKMEIEKARVGIARFINAKVDEIIFTGSGSEANNTVLNTVSCCASTSCQADCPHRKEIITSEIEHPCILETSKCLERSGVPVTYVGVDKHGKVDIEELQKKISKKTAIVSIMMANNEIGTIEDVKKIAKIAHDHGALFHTDAVQALGKIPVDVKVLDVDFLSFSAHKIYGPKGIGGLYIRNGVRFCPLIRGGHQEQGRRAGTENTLGIIGLGKAIEMRKKEMQKEKTRLLALKQKLKKAIEKKIPDATFNGHPTDSLYTTLSVSFKGAEGESILLYLDMESIAVSTGSACASGSLDPSHVLLATGVDAEKAHGAIRFSMGRETKATDIDYVIKKLPPIISKIRGMSTAYSKTK